MDHRVIALMVLLVTFSIFSTFAIIHDDALTRNLKDALNDDQFAIIVSHLKLKKINYGTASTETLFAIKDTEPKTKFLLMFNHQQNRVILETVENKINGREDLSIETLNITEPMKNIIFIINQNKYNSNIDVYVDCLNIGKLPLKKTLKDLMEIKIQDSIIQVYREKKIRTKIYREKKIRDAWEREGCELSLLDDFYYNMETTPANSIRVRRRGDIPSNVHTLDDLNCIGDQQLVKTLNELIEFTKRIWAELERNTQETRHVKKLIEECSACKPEFYIATTPAPPPRPSCHFQSPCYPGARCDDSDGIPRCLSCPRGYDGDGITCNRIKTCSDNPCFPGVRCQDLGNGYRCSRCPPGYTGNGEHCEHLRGCDTNPCHANVACHPQPDAPYYRCGSCPHGYNGNGISCQPVDECDLRNPCDPRLQCTNTPGISPGYRCEPVYGGYSH